MNLTTRNPGICPGANPQALDASHPKAEDSHENRFKLPVPRLPAEARASLIKTSGPATEPQSAHNLS